MALRPLTTSQHATSSQPAVSQHDFLAQTTSLPNWIMDEALAHLNQCETKLLLLIARQTRGWVDQEGKRKTSDWMTGKLIQKRIGCSPASVSRAISSLLRLDMIEVKDENGVPLLTTAQRRRSKKLFFSLCQEYRSQEYRKQEPRTKTTLTATSHSKANNFPSPNFRILMQSQPPKSTNIEQKPAKMLKTSDAKVTTTKETQETKEYENLFVVDKNEQLAKQEVGDEYLFGEERLLSIRDLPSLPQAMQNFIDVYCQKYARCFPGTTPPAVFTSALLRLRNLQGTYSEEELAQLLDLFFSCGLAHIERQHYSLEAFVHNVNILQDTKL